MKWNSQAGTVMVEQSRWNSNGGTVKWKSNGGTVKVEQ